MPNFKITVTGEDQTDLDWLRERCVAAVEDEVATSREENRLDEEVTVAWEWGDDEDG
jgi:hypothetical protein